MQRERVQTATPTRQSALRVAVGRPAAGPAHPHTLGAVIVIEFTKYEGTGAIVKQNVPSAPRATVTEATWTCTSRVKSPSSPGRDEASGWQSLRRWRRKAPRSWRQA